MGRYSRLLSMHRPPITISLNSFHYWYSDPVLSEICSRILKKFSHKVNGFEIQLYFDEIEAWLSRLGSAHRGLPNSYDHLSFESHYAVLGCSDNTIHLEDMKNLTRGREAWLAQALNKIYERTGISLFTIHPDEVSLERWKILLQNLNPKLSLSIENMCFRKAGFQSLAEFAPLFDQYQTLSMTFDTSHWLELGQSMTDPLLKQFFSRYANRVTKAHLSSHTSTAREYKLSPTTSHYFCVDSGYTKEHFSLQSLLEHNDPILVIEGLIPVHDIEMLERELEFVASLAQRLDEHSELNALRKVLPISF